MERRSATDIVVNPSRTFLCLRGGTEQGGIKRKYKSERLTFNLSRIWKNASLSLETSPPDTYKGGKVRWVEVDAI